MNTPGVSPVCLSPEEKRINVFQTNMTLCLSDGLVLQNNLGYCLKTWLVMFLSRLQSSHILVLLHPRLGRLV